MTRRNGIDRIFAVHKNYTMDVVIQDYQCERKPLSAGCLNEPVLSVVVPAHNEASNLRKLIPEILASLDSVIAFEVIIVDDASDDGTSELLRELHAEFPMVQWVRHSRRCGQSTALMTGVDHSCGQIIATLDGDGQNDPRDLVSFLTALEQTPERGITVICGHRTQRRDSWWRKFSSRFANGLRSRILQDATPDSGCGIKMFPRRAFVMLPRFDHMHRFLPALFRRNGMTVVSMPVNHRPRTEGRSHYGTIGRAVAGAVDMLGVYWLIWRYRRTEAERNPKL